ncbi:MAG: hypothetical protein F6K19_51030 [Cyanothece sp. SIO1E1]|nr:hypothetical protein [Cyanothece sp. SIO1E1]
MICYSQPSQHSKSSITSHTISTPILLTTATVAVSWDMVLHTPALLTALGIIGCASIFWPSELKSLKQLTKRLRISSRLLWELFGGAFLLLSLLVAPANAQFFGAAEQWMSANFGGAAGTAIPLVFNVLRGLFLLYVGISLVRVINSARNDEDWQNIARTPLIIVIAVTAGDILTSLITGG